MASLTVYNREGKEVGKVDIDPSEIAPKVSRQLLHDVIVMYQANLRQGTHKSKTRSEVAGTSKKMYRQKGTGNARAGSRRTGIRRGGGHIFALLPRDYSYRLPKKAIQTATRMAFASKLQENEVVVIDDLSFPTPKTKDFAKMLSALKIGGMSTLVAIDKADANVFKSGRNIEGVCISPVSECNALKILKPRRLLITKAALESVRTRAKEINSKKAEAAKASAS